MSDVEQLSEITEKIDKLLKFCQQKKDNAKALYDAKGNELKTETDPNITKKALIMQAKYWGEYEAYHTTIIGLVERVTKGGEQHG